MGCHGQGFHHATWQQPGTLPDTVVCTVNTFAPQRWRYFVAGQAISLSDYLTSSSPDCWHCLEIDPVDSAERTLLASLAGQKKYVIQVGSGRVGRKINVKVVGFEKPSRPS